MTSKLALPLKKGNLTNVIADATGKALLQPCNGVELKAYDETIAPAVITAVNCHDDLVSALKELMAAFSDVIREEYSKNPELVAEVIAARAALEKAGVKP